MKARAARGEGDPPQPSLFEKFGLASEKMTPGQKGVAAILIAAMLIAAVFKRSAISDGLGWAVGIMIVVLAAFALSRLPQR